MRQIQGETDSELIPVLVNAAMVGLYHTSTTSSIGHHYV
jgi:hypothetical protein